MSDKEKMQTVIDILSSLIISRSGSLAEQQYRPNSNADASDDEIKSHTHWVKELREIRGRCENLFTGVIV